MKIAFYHYVWPHYFEEKDPNFRQKISEYLVIYQLAKALEENGEEVIRYANESSKVYSIDSNIKLFHKGLKQIFDFFNFLISPPDVFCLVSKSIFHSNRLVPLLRTLCKARGVKFIIFMGHDESKTSTEVLKDVKPYKYIEDNYWDDPAELERRIQRNELYRPKDKNEFICIPARVIQNNLIKEGWPKDKIMLLPYGIDSEYFVPGEPSTRDSKLKILYAGNGATRKGLPYLLKAFEKLQQNHNVSLTILSHSISNIDIDNVEVLQDIDDEKLLHLYQTHDVFAMPSLLDGWGLTVMEAMSCGLPVIVTPLTGIVDMIYNKDSGFIVSPKKEDEIINVVLSLINDDNHAIEVGQQARASCIQYSWQSIAKKFSNQLNNI